MNKKASVVFCMLGLALIACGQHDMSQSSDKLMNPLVINGTPSKLGDRPYQVSIFKISDKGEKFHFCGGTVISKKWILTAAHCLEGETNDLSIHAGSLDRKDGQEIAVKRFIIHPDHRYSNNDIAVLELESDLKFNNTVSAAEIPVKTIEWENAAPGSTQVLSGWGVMKRKGKKVPSKLLEGSLKVMTQEACYRSFDYGPLKNHMMCGEKNEKGQTGCFGDSGGPFASKVNGKHFIFGIVSAAENDSCSGVTLFTRVSAFGKWIKETTGVQPAKPDHTREFMTIEPIGSVRTQYFPLKNQYLHHLGGQMTIMFNVMNKSQYTIRLQHLNQSGQWKTKRTIKSNPSSAMGHIKGNFSAGSYRLEIETTKQGEGSSYQVLGSYNKNPNPVKPIYDPVMSFELDKLLEISKEHTVILKFYDDFGAGKRLKPLIIERAKKDKGRWVLGISSPYTGNGKYVGRQYEIENLPTLISIKNGKVISRHEGINNWESWLNEQVK